MWFNEKAASKSKETWSFHYTYLSLSLSLDAKWHCAVILGFCFEEWNKCYYNRVYVEKLVNANLININCGSWCSCADAQRLCSHSAHYTKPALNHHTRSHFNWDALISHIDTHMAAGASETRRRRRRRKNQKMKEVALKRNSKYHTKAHAWIRILHTKVIALCHDTRG